MAAFFIWEREASAMGSRTGFPVDLHQKNQGANIAYIFFDK